MQAVTTDSSTQEEHARSNDERVGHAHHRKRTRNQNTDANQRHDSSGQATGESVVGCQERNEQSGFDHDDSPEPDAGRIQRRKEDVSHGNCEGDWQHRRENEQQPAGDPDHTTGDTDRPGHGDERETAQWAAVGANSKR